MNAYKEYQNDFLAGEDGRPDWFARKACNYLTASIEDCYGKLIGDCATEEDVNDMRDQAIPGVLGQLSESSEEWDSEKCPVVKNHLERVKEETAEDVEAQVESAAQKEEEKEEEEAEETQTDEASEDSADNSQNENPDDNETNGEEDVQETTSGENVDDFEVSTETENGENGEDEGPESGTEAAAASLSL